MKKSLLSLVIASALLAGAPLLATAQATKPAAAAPAAQGSASKVVLDSSTRILTTLEQRRAEFRKIRPRSSNLSPANSTARSTAITPPAWCWVCMAAAPPMPT